MAVQRPARQRAGSERSSASSGRLLLRMPPELHAELAEAAYREGTSLNQYIIRRLSGSSEGDERQDAGQTGSPSGRHASTLLLANTIAIAAAACAAIAVLVVALLR